MQPKPDFPAPTGADYEWMKSLPERAQQEWAFEIALSGETDRGAAIIGVSYLETQLERLFDRAFQGGRSRREKLLKGPNAPLGTLSSRIDMAFGIALIGANQRTQLHVLRDIRNQFAHSFHPLSFQTPEVLLHVEKLTFPEIPSKLNMTAPRKKFEFAVIIQMSRLGQYIQDVLPIEHLPQDPADFGAKGTPLYESWVTRIKSIQAGSEPEPRSWYPEHDSPHRRFQPPVAH